MPAGDSGGELAMALLYPSLRQNRVLMFTKLACRGVGDGTWLDG